MRTIIFVFGWFLVSSAIAEPVAVFTVTPTTSFTLYYSRNLNAPRPWTKITNGTGSVTIPVSLLNTITNPPTFSQSLAWNKSADPIVVGYYIYYGGARGTYSNRLNARRATNVTIYGLGPNRTYYAATTYSASGVESPYSSEVSGIPDANYPPVTVFFYVQTSTRATLSISIVQ